MHIKGLVTPATVLEELVRYAQAEPEDTEGFRDLRQDDELCPRFLEKTERILAAFEKYVPLRYDVHRSRGANGPGADIVVRYSSERISDGEERYIILRVESFDEYEPGADLLEKIKADISQAEKIYGERLAQYYVLLCADQRKHAERVRTISVELKTDNTVVTVVEPGYAWFFFAMEDAMIDAVNDKLLYSEDYV
jgi:hypothetical protein